MYMPDEWIRAIEQTAASNRRYFHRYAEVDEMVNGIVCAIEVKARLSADGAEAFYADRSPAYAAWYAGKVARARPQAYESRRIGGIDVLAYAGEPRTEGGYGSRELIQALRDDAAERGRRVELRTVEADVAEAMETLGDRVRRCIQAVYWDNKPTREIAGELGVTQAYVNMLIRRGLKALRETLACYADEYDRGPELKQRPKAGTQGECNRTDYS